MASANAKSTLFLALSARSFPLQGSWEILWISFSLMGIGSSSHRYPMRTRQRSCLMTKIVICARWKCGIHSRWSSLSFSPPCNHFCGFSIVTDPSLLCFMRFLVSKCGNFSLFARSQYSNFIFGTWPKVYPSKRIPYMRSGVWSTLLVTSKSLGTIAFHFHRGTYSGNFVVVCIGWIIFPFIHLPLSHL